MNTKFQEKEIRCKSSLNKAARLIEEAPAILIIAGAGNFFVSESIGLGVDSGLPDYRR